MLDAKKPPIARNIPDWVPIVATIAILALIGGSIISTAVFVKVVTGALTAVMARGRFETSLILHRCVFLT